MKEFAEMLLDFYNSRKDERYEVSKVSDNILEQALGNSLDFLEEETNE